MTVGERIKNRRKQLGFTADRLAEMMKKNRATIYRYESNDIGNMPHDVIVSLANALQVSPAYLVGWDEPKINPSTSSYDYYSDFLTNPESLLSSAIEKIEIPDILMGKWAGDNGIFVMKIHDEGFCKITPLESVVALKHIDVDKIKDGDMVLTYYEHEYSIKRFYKDDENRKYILKSGSMDKRFLDHSVSFSDLKNIKIYGKVVMWNVSIN